MNKIKTLCLVAGALVSVLACEKQKVEVSSLTASFEISANPCYAGDEIHFTRPVLVERSHILTTGQSMANSSKSMRRM